jgi:hypothetical protein
LCSPERNSGALCGCSKVPCFPYKTHHVRYASPRFSQRFGLHFDRGMCKFYIPKRFVKAEPFLLQRITCVINLQHDCITNGNCSLHQIAEQQEREATSRTKHYVQHSDNRRYILNVQGLHNIHHIRRALPPSLLEWRGLDADPAAIRHEAVRKLATANVSKSLQADARKAAKNAFKVVVEGTQGALGTQSSKRRRTTTSRATIGSTSSTNPCSTQIEHNASHSAYSTPDAPLHGHAHFASNPPVGQPPPLPSVPTSIVSSSTPTSYSQFWSQFHIAR